MKLWPWGAREEKKLDVMAHPMEGMRFLGGFAGAGFDRLVAGDSFDYARKVGDATDASVVMACVQWIQRVLPEAPLVIEREKGEGEWSATPHPLRALLERPNPGYTGDQLLQATMYSLIVAGNAYWIVVRSGIGPSELWYVPHWMMEPRWPDDGSEFISHYEYSPGGRAQVRLEPEDVVHFREGIDPRNTRKGLSPIRAALREIWIDMEACTVVASLLRNGCIPGVIISPKDGEGVQPEQGKTLAERFISMTGGERRGKPFVSSRAVTVDRLAFSPNEMDLSAIRDLPEERVCALIGVPAAVIGFSAGLEQTKVGATMKELEKQAWQKGIVPRQSSMAAEIQRSLLPLFRGSGQGRLRVRFDTSEVAALQEDRGMIVERMARGVLAGFITVAEAQRQIGIDTLDTDDVYLRSIAIIPEPRGQAPSPRLEQEPAEQRGLPPPERKENETLREQLVAERATRARPTLAQVRVMRMMDAQLVALSNALTPRLAKFFRAELGAWIARVATEVLEDSGLKQVGEDAVIAGRIAAAARESGSMPTLAPLLEAHYLTAAQEVATALRAAGFDLGIATGLPDPVARAIIITGGRRAGLIDLDRQTTDAIFRAIVEGRAEGEGAAALAKRIVSGVERGPWSTPEIRSLVIARTETKFAQNVSVLHEGRAAGANEFIVFDGRLPTSDDFCIAMDQSIVRGEDVEGLAEDEHPNGTRSFVPRF
jgi:HK97 family phage portal protein